MFSRSRRNFKRDDATTDELQSLFEVRRQCLDAATALVNDGVPLPVYERWGWKARIRTLGRDQDGSLLASVTVEDPADHIRMLRNVRLVKESSLNL